MKDDKASHLQNALALEQQLYQLSLKDETFFLQLLQDSHLYRDQSNKQKSLFYYKRNFWEIGVKVAVAILGLTSLALGELAVPILFSSALFLGINYLFLEYFADFKEPPYLLSDKNDNSPAENISSFFWRKEQEQFQFHGEKNQAQKNMIKTGAGTVFSFLLMMLITPQLSASLILSTLFFITTLFIEAKQQRNVYVENLPN